MSSDAYAYNGLFLCPKCMDVACPVVKERDGLIVVLQCRSCEYQAYVEYFIEMDTSNLNQQEDNLTKSKSGAKPEEN